MKHSLDDTIAAIGTPPGMGGIGVIRISGPASLAIFKSIFSSQNELKTIESHRLYHGWIIGNNKRRIDEVLACYMGAPHSYTGEDVVEISCHGGPVVLGEILSLAIEQGSRMAERGEFTKRAYLNGRMDLTRAEAVMDLVSARTCRARAAAFKQLEGSLAVKIGSIRQDLLGLQAGIEASIDFPDEIGEVDIALLGQGIRACLVGIEKLLSTADEGRALREGIRTAIVGKPNVGKSSLLNALLGEERAIVTEMPGTTRDTIEEVVKIEGIPFIIIDTAGIRHAKDKAEGFGVERARNEMRNADFVLVAIEAPDRLAKEDREIINEARGKPMLVVLNKADLGVEQANRKELDGLETAAVSALKGTGIEGLKRAIIRVSIEKARGGEADDIYINIRHKEALVRANEALQKAAESCNIKPAEALAAAEIKRAIIALGEVTGETVTEEVISAIFEMFCVGK